MRQAYRLMNGQATDQDLVEVRRLHAHPLPGMEPRARTLLGQYLLALKRHQEVLELLDPLLEKEPTLINHFQLGAALAGLGEREEARTLLKAGLDAEPGDLNDSQAKGVKNQIRGLLKELDSPQPGRRDRNHSRIKLTILVEIPEWNSLGRRCMSSTLNVVTSQEYKYGFVTDIEADSVAPGLNEDVIRFISAKKGEPEWLLEFRLKAYRHWLTMTEPDWANVALPQTRLPEDRLLQRPQAQEAPSTPPWMRWIPSCGAPSRSWACPSTSRRPWRAWPWTWSSIPSASPPPTGRSWPTVGIIFCSFSEAVKSHPELVKKYLGSVVPSSDNFYAALNSAVFTDGSFVLHPQGRRLPHGPEHLLPHQQQGIGPVRAHPHRGRGRRQRELPGRLHRAPVRHQPAARGRGGAGGPGPRLHQVQHRAELVRRRQERRGRHLQLRHQARPLQGQAARTSAGPRWRPAAPSPGSTPAACCWATTASASSTAWPSPTTSSRPTPAPR